MNTISKIASSLRLLAKPPSTRILVAFGVNDLKKLYSAGRSFGVISAYRAELSKSVNQKRHGQLIADLQKAGFRNVETLRSSWQDMATQVTHGERSVLVPNIPFEVIFSLCKKYQQDAVLFKDVSGSFGLYFANGTAMMAFDKEKLPVSDSADRNKEYSKGRSMSFGLQLVDDYEFHHNGKPIHQDEVVLKLSSR